MSRVGFWLSSIFIGIVASSAISAAPAAQDVRAANALIEIGLEALDQGIAVRNFTDIGSRRQFLAPKPPALWRMELRSASGQSAAVDAAQGWKKAAISVEQQGRDYLLRWSDPADERLAGMEVICQLNLDGRRSLWRIEVVNKNTAWGVWRVRFPQLGLGRIGDLALDDRLVVPRCSGQLIEAPLNKTVQYGALYPDNSAPMPFYAHYDGDCGLHIGMHDPLAAAKDLRVQHKAGEDAITCTFDIPAENMGKPGSGFRMSGVAAIESFQGDWFDAARIYRDWVQKQARWHPASEARADTPRWMHEIAIWALASGTSQQVSGPVKKFAQFMGVPTALHWYNWHEIPFDTDYPHYFPAKKGFAEGVRELQKSGVRVMPYINGRLWDSGTADFATIALPAATKDSNGKPYIEEYGSGRKLVPMCPVTPLWQGKVSEIVLKLLGEEIGVDGVYIDQVAAAAPRLCFDPSHGHPLGGGTWWVDGYWKMLGDLRGQMKRTWPEKMLTTECTAEPYAHLFDGYLTWHYQYPDQIPLFAAVYGGKIQLFGRAYRGGPSKDLALRMKAAQSLVYGEQIGWIGPEIINDTVGGPFLRRMARLRYALRDYLADGEMARPPQLEGEIPRITADWQWSGKWEVTTEAIFRGAWKARDGRLALIFVNATDKPLAFELVFDATGYGIKTPRLRVSTRDEEGRQAPVTENPSFRRRIQLDAFQAIALEVEGQ